MGKINYTAKLLRDIWLFALQRKVYWMLPVVIVGLLITIMVTAAHVSAPFIYTLF